MNRQHFVDKAQVGQANLAYGAVGHENILRDFRSIPPTILPLDQPQDTLPPYSAEADPFHEDWPYWQTSTST
jgi:hypothetical protein